MSPQQAKAVSGMAAEQAGQVLGLPAPQAAKMLADGLDYYAIRAKPGGMPKVFVSEIAPTRQGATATPGGGQQVIVPNRALWTAAQKIDIGKLP
jgi:filamentous hemagglutinin